MTQRRFLAEMHPYDQKLTHASTKGAPEDRRSCLEAYPFCQFVDEVFNGNSLLCTSRRRSLPWISQTHSLKVTNFSRGEAESIFRIYLGDETVEKHRDALLEFAEHVERLPVATATVMGSMSSRCWYRHVHTRSKTAGSPGNAILQNMDCNGTNK
jgi:hypothetical protein